MNEAFENVKLNDATVHQILSGGGTLEDCVVALSKQKQEIADKAMNLSLIAPKKMRARDGKTFIWRCPDELVPEMQS